MTYRNAMTAPDKIVPQIAVKVISRITLLKLTRFLVLTRVRPLAGLRAALFFLEVAISQIRGK